MSSTRIDSWRAREGECAALGFKLSYFFRLPAEPLASVLAMVHGYVQRTASGSLATRERDLANEVIEEIDAGEYSPNFQHLRQGERGPLSPSPLRWLRQRSELYHLLRPH